MQQLIYLQRSLSGEVQKYKNTLALYLAILAPCFIVTINFFIFFFKGTELVRPGDNPWSLYTMYNVSAGLSFLFPLYIILITVLINYVEHSNNTWKHLYALALPKWTTYVSKSITSLGLVTLSIMIFCFLVITGGLLLRVTSPELLFQDYSYFKEIISICAQAYVATFAMLAIQFWLSFRWNSVVLPISIGMGAFIFSIILQRWEYIIYFPYSFPFSTALKVNNGNPMEIIDQVWYGLFGGLLMLILGLVDTNKRDIL